MQRISDQYQIVALNSGSRVSKLPHDRLYVGADPANLHCIRFHKVYVNMINASRVHFREVLPVLGTYYFFYLYNNPLFP